MSAHAAPMALVTGASSGIGLAIAKQLLSGGWRVHGLDIAPTPDLGTQFTGSSLDLTQSDELANELERILLDGTPQALIHAAGILRVGALGALSQNEGHLMWQLHVEVATQLANRILPLMHAAKSGRMVMLGSRVSVGMAGRSQYAASKAALVTLARSWAQESIMHGVTVNVVSPAATDTPMLHDPQRATTTPKLPPMGRLIQAQEVAALVGYLVGPYAAAITGQDIAICGGASVQR
ncbi:MAG: SDR family oxidoreductase [Betaproteobacteria bacterium]|nr:SDR family oxidoreductase [Betaproteobacteria bacterium]